jgi:hypothetical protein
VLAKARICRKGIPSRRAYRKPAWKMSPAPVVSTASTRVEGEKIASRPSHPNAPRGPSVTVDVLGA